MTKELEEPFIAKTIVVNQFGRASVIPVDELQFNPHLSTEECLVWQVGDKIVRIQPSTLDPRVQVVDANGNILKEILPKPHRKSEVVKEDLFSRFLKSNVEDVEVWFN